MPNINLLNYALQSMRVSAFPSTSIMTNTVLSDIIKDGNSAFGIDSYTYDYGYNCVLQPDYVEDYFNNPTQKTVNEYLEVDDTVFDYAFTDALKASNYQLYNDQTGLLLYKGDENWLKQSVALTALLARNNELRYLRGISFIANTDLYSIEFLMTRTTTNTYLADSGNSYYSTTSTSDTEGYYYAVVEEIKQVEYNATLGEYYVSKHQTKTAKAKLTLTDLGRVFIDEMKISSHLSYDINDADIYTLYDKNTITLIDGEWVDYVNADDLLAPTYATTNTIFQYVADDPNVLSLSYKEFLTYDDVVNAFL